MLTKLKAILAAMLCIPLVHGQALSQEPAPVAAPFDWVPVWLLVTAIALAVVMLILGTLVARIAVMKMIQKSQTGVKVWVLLIVGLGAVHPSQAAIGDFAWTPSVDTLNGILLGLIGLELLIIFYFVNWLRALVLPAKPVKVKSGRSRMGLWWDRVNRSVSVEKEADVQLDHNYDGIRELDNALPPWWLYGFYLTIVFAGVYAWRYHVSRTAPLQVQELAMENAEAEQAMAQFASQAAEQVDEHSVQFNADASYLAKGRETFAKNCTSCHGEWGQGASIGPNLSDAYWLHGGEIGQIFRTIQYGVPEKGMVAWGQQLSASKIAELASYIWSLQGAEIQGAKEPQGELYQPQNSSPSDSASVELSLR